MPVPWVYGLEHGRTHTFEVSHRGISLRQLRDLRDLLIRLCKTSLLKGTDDICTSVDSEEGEHPMEWPKINQHHVRHKLVMQVIRKESSSSWVELVAKKQQKPNFFVSHNWSECFRDFMIAIEHHVLQAGVNSRENYWICVFAMNQWEVDVGKELVSGPFITALRNSDCAVLMLDKTASSLDRLWCLLEVFTILTKYRTLLDWYEPDLTVLTPKGIVGSPLVSSGPVVEALKNVDTRQATATQGVDRRRIRNYIAKGEKNQLLGLKVTPQDLLVLDDSPQFANHEEELIRNNEEEFRNFDDKIKELVLAQSVKHHGMKKRSNGVAKQQEHLREKNGRLKLEYRGLMLADIRTLWRKIQKKCAAWKRVGRTTNSKCGGDSVDDSKSSGISEHVTIYDFVWEVLEGHRGTSYFEEFHKIEEGYAPREAQYFMTIPYAMKFEEMIAAIEWHAEARHLPDQTVYWAWCLSLSLDDLQEWFADPTKKGTTPTDSLLKSGTELEGLLQIIDSDLVALQRPNSVFELWQWLCSKKSRQASIGRLSFDLSTVHGIISCAIPFPGLSYQFGSFPEALAQAFVNFDVRHIPVDDKSKQSWKQQLDKIRDETGIEEFNQRVARLGCGPVLRALAARNTRSEIERIVHKTDIPLISPEIGGVSGEDPLMIAAATGSLKSLDTLLRLQADPNRKDSIGETALHYAALAGQCSAAKILIQHGARTDSLSIYEESAYDVAKQNPGFFLVGDTQHVERLLEKAQAWHSELQRIGEKEWEVLQNNRSSVSLGGIAKEAEHVRSTEARDTQKALPTYRGGLRCIAGSFRVVISVITCRRRKVNQTTTADSTAKAPPAAGQIPKTAADSQTQTMAAGTDTASQMIIDNAGFYWV